MAQALYFDCFSGASGDMLLGTLLDLGLDADDLRALLGRLPLTGWRLDVMPVRRQGLSGTTARVVVEEAVEQPARRLADVEAVVRGGTLPGSVQERAVAVFRALAEAEAHIHGTTTEEVHFHEVGAVDALVDIVGAVGGLYLLGLNDGAVYCSGLPLGAGWLRSAHGRLPAPAPATLELLRRAGAPVRRTPSHDGNDPGELTTPTGAALLTTLATFAEPPFRRIQRVGYGFGTRQLPWPNAVRAWLGEVALPHTVQRDTVVQLETNLDDSTPEQLGFAMERLLEAGALDVTFSPLQMKKNRPGVLVRVLAAPPAARPLAELLLAHTSALGVRYQTLERYTAPRAERVVSTPWGPVRVKEKHLADGIVAAPEYEDCAALARTAGLPLMTVYDTARQAAYHDPRNFVENDRRVP